ncbi:MAG: permease of the drug/metabolite transporter superfamily [Nocardioides sp.]|nr:permease of the drug/metabolite transporter superfamily [Nocardioides sp.]
MTAPRPGAAPWQVWSALGVVYVVWGSTYLAITFVVEDLPPLLSASLRFTCAALLLTLYLTFRRGRRALAAPARQWLRAAGIGVLLLLGGNGLVTLAEQRELPSGLAALLVAGVPFFVVLLRALAGDRPSRGTVVGVVLGFTGVAVLLLPGARPSGVSGVAVALVLTSSVLWSVGSFLAAKGGLPVDPLVTTVAEMTGGAIGLAAAGLLRGEVLHPASVGASSWLALGYLVLFGSVAAFTAYSWLLGVAPTSQVATYAYVNPVVAVALGSVVLGEEVGLLTVVGGLVTVLAVAVVVTQEGRRRRGAALGEASGEKQTPVQTPTPSGAVDADSARAGRAVRRGA